MICPDLPGFGREPVLEMEPSMEAYAGWLRRVLETEGVEIGRTMLVHPWIGCFAEYVVAKEAKVAATWVPQWAWAPPPWTKTSPRRASSPQARYSSDSANLSASS